MENQEKDLKAVWQTCVQMAHSASQRRDTMNNLFVTLNLAILAAISWLWDTKTIFLCAAGMIICTVWILYINNFKRLNAAKYQVIIDLEEKLWITPMKDEWEILGKTKRYLEGTKIERILPLAFAIGYVVIAVLMITIKRPEQAAKAAAEAAQAVQATLPA